MKKEKSILKRGFQPKIFIHCVEYLRRVFSSEDETNNTSTFTKLFFKTSKYNINLYSLHNKIKSGIVI